MAMPHAIREAAAAFRRAPLLVGLSALMVALALFVLGLFGLAAHNIHRAIRQMEERVEIVAYLRDEAREDEVLLASSELERLPEVEDVRHVSKAQALETAREELPEFRELFADSGVNPLPASLEIHLQPGSRTSEVVDRVAGVARAYPFVEDVRYGAEWLDKVFLIRRIGAAAALVLGGGFGIVAALIIGTAVRIAIFARRDEIRIMQLVGAKNGFIGRPFLLEGFMTGLLGGVIAVALTWVTHQALATYLFDLAWLPWPWVAAGVGAGGVFGTLASGFALRWHLRKT